MPLSAADLGKLGDTPITIQSTFFPNIYLRMDGTGVTSFTGSGGGTVNCQYGTGPWTGYKVRPQADGSYAFESVAFPNVFLRMDGTGVPATMAAWREGQLPIRRPPLREVPPSRPGGWFVLLRVGGLPGYLPAHGDRQRGDHRHRPRRNGELSGQRQRWRAREVLSRRGLMAGSPGRISRLVSRVVSREIVRDVG